MIAPEPKPNDGLESWMRILARLEVEVRTEGEDRVEGVSGAVIDKKDDDRHGTKEI